MGALFDSSTSSKVPSTHPNRAAVAVTGSAGPRSERGGMITWRVTLVVPVVAAALVLSACVSSSGTGTAPASPLDQGRGGAGQVPNAPQLDAARVAEGEAIYGQYCSSCHGADLSGDPGWKTRNADGSFRPPPHDNSGHTWHHSDGLLLALTRDGSGLPESRMPRFGNALTDDEIGAVFEFLKSTWGPEERAFQWQVTWTEQQGTDA